MPPKISVCIPVKNGGVFLPLAVESVLGQSRDDIELIIVDNCSTDGTATWLRQTVGDVVCPGTQGTAFLVGQGRDILTNAHVFVDENGNDRANLDKCFWQN